MTTTSKTSQLFSLLETGPKTKREIREKLKMSNSAASYLLTEAEGSGRLEVFASRKSGIERELYTLTENGPRVIAEEYDELHSATDTPLVDTPLKGTSKNEVIRTLYI